MATTPIHIGYRIGPFVLDLRSGELTKNGRRIRLQEKPRSLLVAFAERPGEVINRTELHERLWPDDTFVDFEDGLNTAMRKLREALDDDPQVPQYIETVRGRGYRFVATVETVSGMEDNRQGPQGVSGEPTILIDTSEHFHPVSSAAVATRSRNFDWKVISATVLACAVLATAIVLGTRWRKAHGPVISVAVLPFSNMTGDPSRDYIVNGITEELIARLGQLRGNRLRVIAPTSALTYVNTTKSAKQIGQELRVQYLIEGSLQQQGADVRVAVNLVRVNDQSRLWANTYDGDLSDLFEFETTVADSVGHALSLSVPSMPPIEYRPGKFEAHDAYLKGLYFASQRSKSGFEQAIENFSDAVAIDPKYAAAYAQLASAYGLMGQYTWMNPKTASSQSWAAAEQALSLDPAQAQAHAALGFSMWYYDWDARDAEAEFRKAIVLDPSNVDAHHHYEQLLMTAGRFQEAEAQMHDALEVDPRSPILRTNLGWLYYYENRFPEAIQQLQSVIAEDPAFLSAHYKMWWAYSATGDDKDASQEFLWVIRHLTDPADENRIMRAYQQGGYRAALGEFATGSDTNYYGTNVDGARSLAFAGDQQGALRLLQAAYSAHEGWMLYVARDPAFSPLRKESKFQELVAAVKKGPDAEPAN
ncbi:MAG TPA: winged helix-turn-helix domain-containing protein [Acidobacteriaceae bacterium]|jgi:TolB-like protein/DNA-binding winged helix-turn-helix (wHTH) protein/Tfp pilus assembly protein PilF|nr:winged helix-turn-helix domain-containing protein [Acidobacteriaceae bacterium]